MSKRTKFTVAAMVAASIGVTACASGGGLLGSSDGDPCNVLVGALIGGIGGVLLDRNKRGRGAAIGGVAGAVACVAVNSVTRRTRTSQQVEEDYRRTNAGRLPGGAPVVQSYDVRINPRQDVRSGERFQVVSSMTVVRSADQPVTEVKESLTLVSPDGKNRSAEKTASEQPGSGAFENTFTLTLPSGVAPGTYPVRTQLTVNGQPAAERQQDLRVTALAGGGIRVALLDRDLQ